MNLKDQCIAQRKKINRFISLFPIEGGDTCLLCGGYIYVNTKISICEDDLASSYREDPCCSLCRYKLANIIKDTPQQLTRVCEGYLILSRLDPKDSEFCDTLYEDIFAPNEPHRDIFPFFTGT